MRSITKLEREIEKDIIETLSSYRQIKNVLEDNDYKPERKIKEALMIINHLTKMRKNKFKLDSEYAAGDLVLDGEYEFTDNLAELKLRILHKIMNSTSSDKLMSPDDWSLFDNIK